MQIFILKLDINLLYNRGSKLDWRILTVTIRLQPQ